MLNNLDGAHPETHVAVAEKALSVPGARIHLYGKGKSRPVRKMGHFTVLADSMLAAEGRVVPLIKFIDGVELSVTKYPRSTHCKSQSRIGHNL